MLNIIGTTQPDLLHVQASGKLEEADIERLRPELALMLGHWKRRDQGPGLGCRGAAYLRRRGA